ncbi:MAG: succinylglutamate desuccinylase/aspartoacylase family protein [Bdellovibrionota bacterium]
MKDSFSFVAALHGNELTPYLALKDMKIPVVLGNPYAAFKRERYVDRDLNSSFGLDGETYEEKRARDLLDIIPKDSHVIDFHTFSCKSEPFAIIVDKEMLPLAKKTGIKKIVLMNHDIKKGGSLLSYRSGVSVEVGEHDTLESYKLTQYVARSLLGVSVDFEVEVFETFGVIEEDREFHNFVYNEEGFIPVLAGEVAYKPHGFYGLMAKKV